MTRIWDAVVIGAGPAGAVAAHGLARRGHSVLLLDRASFPRGKVCGGCLSARSLALLVAAGLQRSLPESMGCPVNAVSLTTPWSAPRTFALPPGRAIDRARLDERLVAAAVEAGAEFRSGQAARVLPAAIGPTRRIALPGPAGGVVDARVVLVADGLGHPSMRGLGLAERILPSSRVGVAATVDGDEIPEMGEGKLPAGTLSMAISGRGYVGMVRFAAGRINVAAALDAAALRDQGPAAAVAGILDEAGTRAPSRLHAALWAGTRPLSRRLRRAHDFRMLVLGDASGYTEPFTGEGMAGAIEDALVATHVLDHDFGEWSGLVESTWRAHWRSRRRRERWSRGLARILRSPRAIRTSLRIVDRFPQLASGSIARVQGVSGARWAMGDQ